MYIYIHIYMYTYVCFAVWSVCLTKGFSSLPLTRHSCSLTEGKGRSPEAPERK